MTSYSKAYTCGNCGVAITDSSGYCENCTTDIVANLHVVAAKMLSEGESLGAVADTLADSGLDRDSALEIAKSSQQALRDDDFRAQIQGTSLDRSDSRDRSPANDIVWGLIWVGGGTAVTIFSGELGFGVLFFGAIIYGIYRIIKGIARSLG